MALTLLIKQNMSGFFLPVPRGGLLEAEMQTKGLLAATPWPHPQFIHGLQSLHDRVILAARRQDRDHIQGYQQNAQHSKFKTQCRKAW